MTWVGRGAEVAASTGDGVVLPAISCVRLPWGMKLLVSFTRLLLSRVVLGSPTACMCTQLTLLHVTIWCMLTQAQSKLAKGKEMV